MKEEIIDEIKAVILDMDGVITQTAKIHRKAWKLMFNDFLMGQSGEYSEMTDDDYKEYIDGKLRYDGVKSFLQSREINIPYGSLNDSVNEKTVCGLGNKKNEIFLSLLDNIGVETYDDTIIKIKQWRRHGLNTAAVSSSKNCKEILKKANIEDLFDTRIDGLISEARGLRGKPEPDIFIEAARTMGFQPESCVLIEDAIAGMQAGCKGNFGLVIGVCRNGEKITYYQNGADIVVETLEQIELFHNSIVESFFMHDIPSLFTHKADFNSLLNNRLPALFLDYDGTLSPIVNHPENAVLSKEMKNILTECAAKFTIAIISGRDMVDLKQKINIDNLVYAGSHGFRISGPDGLYMEYQKSSEILKKLDQIEETLHNSGLDKINGIQIDRKRYAIGIHYRNADANDIPQITSLVNKTIDKYPGFKGGKGKKILEIKPNVDWHKGKAVNWILEELNIVKGKNVVPIYIGDDVTDEDAFKALKYSGIGIQVGTHGYSTEARYRLKNTYQVGLFMEMLNTDINFR